MTVILSYDRGKATRTHRLDVEQVPSQDVSRYQAINPPHPIHRTHFRSTILPDILAMLGAVAMIALLSWAFVLQL